MLQDFLSSVSAQEILGGLPISKLEIIRRNWHIDFIDITEDIVGKKLFKPEIK